MSPSRPSAPRAGSQRPRGWDAIIVGAGPAGSVAAIEAARAGARVLILDRTSFPREKACGDALPPAAVDLLRELGVRPPLVLVDRVTFVSPGGRAVSMPREPGIDGALVRRSSLDQALLSAAIEAGAIFRQSAVQGLLFGGRGEVVGVDTEHGEERAPVVLGADGATSIVARTLSSWRAPERTRSIALRGYVEVEGDDAELLLHFFADAQPAYGWFFPCGGGMANVGVFLSRSAYRARAMPLPALLRDYLDRPDLRARLRGGAATQLAAWQLPLFDPARPRVFPGALLAGDAGGFVNPFTGAGIYEAMVTGRAAATAILRAARRGDFGRRDLADYDRIWRQALGRAFSLGRLAQEGLTRAPQAMELAFPAAGVLPPVTRALSHWLFSTRG